MNSRELRPFREQTTLYPQYSGRIVKPVINTDGHRRRGVSYHPALRCSWIHCILFDISPLSRSRVRARATRPLTNTLQPPMCNIKGSHATLQRLDHRERENPGGHDMGILVIDRIYRIPAPLTLALPAHHIPARVRLIRVRAARRETITSNP